MGTITSINRQRRPGRYNIMVDGDFTIAVAEKVIVDLKLAVGQELDQNRLADAARAEDESKALSSALRLLEVRERSEHEIRSRLEQKGYDNNLITNTITKLRGYGFVDDQQFTASWIQSRARSRPSGIHKLRSELSQKGVAKDTIDTAIDDISDADQVELAKKAISKRTKPDISNFENRQAAYSRDAGYLARRGFGWAVIKIVLSGRYGQPPDSDDFS